MRLGGFAGLGDRRMSQTVWADRQAHLRPERPDNPVETRTGQPARPFAGPVKVGKHGSWMPAAHRQPRPQRRLGGLRQASTSGCRRPLPRTATLGHQVDMREVQGHDFAAAQPQVIEQPEGRPVALRFGVPPGLRAVSMARMAVFPGPMVSR